MSQAQQITLLQNIIEKITNELKDIVIEKSIPNPKRATITVKAEGIEKAAQLLKNEGFDVVASVSGVDYIKEKRFAVVYHLLSRTKPQLKSAVVALKTYINRDKPEVPTLVNVWESALYHERETHEMYGIIFKGHPNLGPLLLEDWNGPPPLRKDYGVRREEQWEIA
ncbi:MAG: NADH-quinone oxidoreductase subunit C [Thermoprotei archaeon]|jgi:NADH-quinone oxidoreductase subunit C